MFVILAVVFRGSSYHLFTDPSQNTLSFTQILVATNRVDKSLATCSGQFLQIFQSLSEQLLPLCNHFAVWMIRRHHSLGHVAHFSDEATVSVQF